MHTCMCVGEGWGGWRVGVRNHKCALCCQLGVRVGVRVQPHAAVGALLMHPCRLTSPGGFSDRKLLRRLIHLAHLTHASRDSEPRTQQPTAVVHLRGHGRDEV